MSSDQEMSVDPTDSSQETSVDLTDSSTDAPAEQSINSRTRHLITAVSRASGKDQKLQALDSLLQHLHHNPEARLGAVKEKAVNVLLKQRYFSGEEDVLSYIREALSLLGYVDPPKGHGLRILSIDGGGVRGLLALKFMMKLEELTKKPIYELFDYICGVSTGSILTCSFPQKKSLDEILAHYKDLSKQVFQSSLLSGTGRLIRNHGYYDTTKWEDLLRNLIGSTKMIHTSRDETCPKISAISTVVNTEKSSSFVFRNYELRHSVRSQYYGTSEHLLWEAVRASSAAPLYFKEFPLGNHLHQDGGITANNPCGIAIHEARLLWPGETIQCVVSLGTGLSRPKLTTKSAPAPSSSSWSNQISKVVESATDTEAIHNALGSVLPENRYYRFNPDLTEMLSMSEIRPEKIDQLELDADSYYYRNEERFKAAAQTLLEPRSTRQRVGDWLSLQANILGLKANL